VPLANNQAKLVFLYFFDVDFIARNIAESQADIDAIFNERGFELSLREDVDRECYSRVAPIEFLHQRADQVRCEKGEEGHSQRSTERICDIFHRAFAGIEFAKSAAYVLDVRSALVRRFDDASGSIEQLHAKLNF
jgi:hypothetical protein